jgi:hypothetical protein
MRIYLTDRVFQEKGLYVYNMHYIVEKHFSISIPPVRSRGGSLASMNINFNLKNQMSCIDNTTTLRVYGLVNVNVLRKRSREHSQKVATMSKEKGKQTKTSFLSVNTLCFEWPIMFSSLF